MYKGPKVFRTVNRHIKKRLSLYSKIVVVLAVVLVTALLVWLPFTRSILLSLSGADASKGGAWFVPSATTITIFVNVVLLAGVLTYVGIDYRQHRKPLKLADPTVDYTLPHHIRIVTMPLLSYKWRALSTGAGVFSVVMLAFITTTLLTGVFTRAANSVSVTIQEKSGNNISAPIFEVTFSEPIDPSTFGTDDITLSGLSNATVSSITEVAPNDHTKFEVAVTSPDSGEVTMSIAAARTTYEASTLAITGSVPRGLVNDNLGNTYVTSTLGGGPVTKITPDGTRSEFANVGVYDGSGVVDSANNLYVIYQNEIRKITPDGTVTLFATVGSGRGNMTIDAANNIYTGNSDDDTISRVEPNGTVTTYGSVSDQGTSEHSMAADNAGNVYLTHYGNDRNIIRKITPDGTVTDWVTLSGIVRSIYYGADGFLYAGNMDDKNVAKIASDGSSVVLGTTNHAPIFITMDDNNNIFTIDQANSGHSYISKITPAGVSTEIADYSSVFGSEFVDLVIRPNGDFYTLSDYTNILYEVSSAGVVTPTGNPGSYPQGMARDSQGNIYTANTWSKNITKVEPNGQTSILTTLSGPIDRIVLGADGNLYTYYSGGSGEVTVLTTAGTIVRTLHPGHTLKEVLPDSDGGVFSINYSTSTVYYTSSADSVSSFSLGGSIPDVLVLDTNNNAYTAIDGVIKQVTTTGTILDWATAPSGIRKLKFDASSELYALSGSGNTVFTKFPSGVGSGTTMATVSELVNDFVFDEDGNIHYMQYNGGDLKMLEQDGTISTTPYSGPGGFRVTDEMLTAPDGTIFGLDARENAIYKAVRTKHGIYTNDKQGNALATGTDRTALIVGVVEDFEVRDSNSNAMALEWQQVNSDSLGSFSDYTYSGVKLEYKKQSDSSWTSVPFLGMRREYKLYNLEPGTTYDLRIAYGVQNSDGTDQQQTDWVTLSHATTAQATIHISTCDQLQNIGLNRNFDPFNGIFEIGDPSAKYVLDQDIDCSATAEWTWLTGTPYEYKGFSPIVQPDSGLGFSGELDGQGFAIRNLTLVRLDGDSPYVRMLGKAPIGIFSELQSATIKNLKLENAAAQVSTVRTQSTQLGTTFDYGTGLLAGAARNSTITSVAVSGTVSSAGPEPYQSGPPYLMNFDDDTYQRPVAMAQDSDGNTYILQPKGTVRKLNPSGVMVKEWDMHEELGDDDEPRGFYPQDITVDNQNRVLISGLFITDNLGNPQRDSIQRYDTNGQYIDAIGSTGTGNGEFNIASNVVAAGNYVYVLDLGNARIQRMNLDGSNAISWPIDLPVNVELARGPNVLTVDSQGHVFYMNSEEQTVHRFDSDGGNEVTFSTNATIPDNSWTNYAAPALSVDQADHLYVSSWNSPYLQRFNNDGTGVQNWAQSLWNSGSVVDGNYTGFRNVLSMTPSGSGMALFYTRDIYGSFDNLRMAGVMKLDASGAKVSDFENWQTVYDAPVIAGGLIGVEINSTINKVSSSVAMNIKSSPYQDHIVGGIVGIMFPQGGGFGQDPSLTNITNSYFNGAIDLDGGLSLAGGLAGWDFGYYGAYNPDLSVVIENSYSAGSITAHGGAKYISGGGIIGSAIAVGNGDKFQNLFSTTAITGPTLVASDYPNASTLFYELASLGEGRKGGLMGFLFNFGTALSSPGPIIGNNFYDQQQTGQASCSAYAAIVVSDSGGGPQEQPIPGSICTTVNTNGSQADYFTFNRTNGPLGAWNFSNIWRTNQGGLPTLGLNTPPSVPQNFGGTPAKTSVTLAWQTPADNGGRPIVDYTIQYRKAGTSTWQTLSHDPSPATSYDISNLEAGTTYEFQVAAVNEIGASSFVLGTSVTTTEETPTTPTTPTNPTNPTNPTRPTRPGNTGGTPVATPNAEATRDTPIPGFPSTGGIAQLPEVEPAVVKRISTLERRIPFFFASLLLFVALAYAIMAYRDYKRSQVVMALVERERKDASNIKAFLSITTHYLRTPLTILEGALELFTANKVLAPTVLQTVQTEVKSLAVVISNIQTQNDSLESETRPGSLSSATSKTRLEDLVKAKRFWMPLIGVALLIAIADVIITVTGKYEIAELRLANTVALFAFGGLAIFIATYLQSRQSQTREQHKVLLENEQWLAQRKREMLGDAAEGLSTATASLKRVSQEFREVTHTQVYFNGLASLEKLARSLSNARDFSRVRTDAPLQNIQSVAASAVESLQAQIQQKGIVVQQQLDANAAIQAQPAEAQFLISSLVENAVKFSPEKGTVTIAAKSTKSGTTIRVTDHGPGIPADKLQNIMEPFSRGEPTETFDQEGLGLGLYTNKLLTEKLGGKLNITSGRGGGVVATVSLPTQTAESSGMVNGLITPTSSGV